MEKNETKKILFTGGGTGGHVFPLIAVIRELKKIFPQELEIYYMGPRDNISKEYMEGEGVDIKYIFTGKLRRYWGALPFFQNIIDIFFKLPIGIIQSFYHIFVISPDLIFSKGGHGSLPPVLAGKILQVPVFLHESDVVPGMINRFLQHLSTEVFVSFPDTEGVNPKKQVIVGNLIRQELLKGDKEKGYKLFDVKGKNPIILILGGSQGSERINDIIISVLNDILKDFEIIHQCGIKNYNYLKTEATAVIFHEELKENYHLYPFFNEKQMKYALASADLIVSRAGAGSIFEIAASGKPSVLLPLPEAAQDHQTKNAYTYSKTGAAMVLEEENLTPHFFLEQIKQLFFPPQQLEIMSNNAKSFSRPRAAHIVASYIKEYLIR